MSSTDVTKSAWYVGAMSLVTALLGLALLAIFGYVVIQAVTTVNSPPLQADPVPSATTTVTAATLPPQSRGAYDPQTRLLAILAVVTPLLTTVVGFYVGQRTGQAAGEAVANSKAGQQIDQITHTIQSAANDADPAVASPAKSLLAQLQSGGLTHLKP